MKFGQLERREFLTLIGGVAAWPLGARAQQPDRVRRIGALIGLLESDPEGQARLGAFRKGLQELGWSVGRNIHIDYRWAGDDTAKLQAYAAELVALKPDLIFAASGTPLAALNRETRTIPIVFANSNDPASDGFVDNWARPGGNISGFPLYEYATAGKWLELLKEIAPHVSRAAVIYDPSQPSHAGMLGAIEASATSFGVQFSAAGVRDAAEIDHAVAAFGDEPNGGLVILASIVTAVHRQQIVALAAQYRLPAIYPYRLFVAAGGLASYGAELLDLYRRAASYVDRILKGEKVSELPIQAPTKYELVINLKTAKALGLDVPWLLQHRADEVIE
jgi:putative tryptophan/tyrosine transport system substrate-binding protein